MLMIRSSKRIPVQILYMFKTAAVSFHPCFRLLRNVGAHHCCSSQPWPRRRYTANSSSFSLSKCVYSTGLHRMSISKDYTVFIEVLKTNKYTKKFVEDISEADLHERIAHFESYGFHAVEVLENPRLLSASLKQLETYKKQLEFLGINRVTLPLLKKAHEVQDEWKLSKQIAAADDDTNFEGKTQSLCKILNVSCDDLEDIAAHLPHIMACCMTEVVQKIELLKSHGVTTKQILQHCSVLYNIPTEKLHERLRTLKGYHITPVPVAALGQANHNFKRRIEIILKKERARYLKLQFLEALSLPKDEDLIKSLAVVNRISFSTLQPKVDFLKSKGYTEADIYECLHILLFSLQKLVTGYSELLTLSLEHILLTDLCQYIRFRKTGATVSFTRRKFANILSWSAKDINLPQADSFLYEGLDSTTVLKIYFFLKSLGFEDQHLKTLPLIFTHELHSVIHAWESLLEKNNPSIKSDKHKMLNLLEYYLEKEKNFSARNLHT